MTETHADARQCPTRRDGRAALFTHRVTEPECQSRQRGMFHRCFSCAHNNAWVARNGPIRNAVAATEPEAPAPVVAGEAPLGSAPSEDAPRAASEVLAPVRVAR